jgi:hypothetical protein
MWGRDSFNLLQPNINWIILIEREEKMRSIDEISYGEFFEIMEWLDTCSNESKEKFIRFLFSMCDQCRLARELLVVIAGMEAENFDIDYLLAIEHHKVIVAIWLLLNEPDKMDTIH